MRTLMNVQASEILKSKGKKIVFVHVGKCAGDSAIQSLNNALGDDFRMFEMHVYDSNRIIREVVRNAPDDVLYLIAARDPLDRFISSFNWDKHNTFLSVESPGAQVRSWFEEFYSINVLARSLTDPDQNKAVRALQFVRFGHMGMGQSWYTPIDLLPLLPKDQTFICETENFSADIHHFVSAVEPRLEGQPIRLFHEKSDFAANYDQPDVIFSKALSMEARRNLRVLLNEDVQVWTTLRNTFRRAGM